MTADVIVFGAGAILVLIGVLGGGLEVKEIKLPQVTVVIRAIALFVGLGFIGLGVWMKTPTGATSPPIGLASGTQTLPAQPPPAKAPEVALNVAALKALPGSEKIAQPDERQIRFRIANTLGSSQLREDIEISFDGRNVGKLAISEENRVDSLVVTLQAHSSFKYQLWGYTYIKSDGSASKLLVTGSGDLSVNDGDTLKIWVVSQADEDIKLELRKSN